MFDAVALCGRARCSRVTVNTWASPCFANLEAAGVNARSVRDEIPGERAAGSRGPHRRVPRRDPLHSSSTPAATDAAALAARRGVSGSRRRTVGGPHLRMPDRTIGLTSERRTTETNDDAAPATKGVTVESLATSTSAPRSRAWQGGNCEAKGVHRARWRLRPDSRPQGQAGHRLRLSGNDYRPSKWRRYGVRAGSGLAGGPEHLSLASRTEARLRRWRFRSTLSGRRRLSPGRQVADRESRPIVSCDEFLCARCVSIGERLDQIGMKCQTGGEYFGNSPSRGGFH